MIIYNPIYMYVIMCLFASQVIIGIVITKQSIRSFPDKKSKHSLQSKIDYTCMYNIYGLQISIVC